MSPITVRVGRLPGRKYVTLCLLFLAGSASGHGNVALKDDQCYMELGFVEAHFTIYQPQDSGHREFCESIPRASETVFVLENERGGPYTLPMDFRIIRDITDLGTDAAWEDIARIDNLDAVTVFYSAPRIHPLGVFANVFHFSEAGDYIGIVTASDPRSDQAFQAVFAFQVGRLQFSTMYMSALIAATLATILGWLAYRRRGHRTIADG